MPLPHLQIRPSSIHDRRRLSVSFSRRLSKIFTNLINTMPAKSCPLDPMLLKRLILHIAPVICHLCHLSLHSGVFPTKLKQTLVLPLLKKNSLDPETASSYGPISNLRYISKVIERVVARRSPRTCPITVSYQLDSPPTAPSTLPKRLCCRYTTTWYAPSTTVKFRCSCYLI